MSYLMFELLSPTRTSLPRGRGSSWLRKVSLFQSYNYDNTTAIDVITILLYTSSTTAELALAVTVHGHASES